MGYLKRTSLGGWGGGGSHSGVLRRGLFGRGQHVVIIFVSGVSGGLRGRLLGGGQHVVVILVSCQLLGGGRGTSQTIPMEEEDKH